MIDYADFLSRDKSMLIAPAGYGKTYTIAKCVMITQGPQLVLTHTHAGVAAIKEKLSKNNTPNSKFHIETISSFAQKYVLSFYTSLDMPKQSDNNYFPFIISKAKEIIKKRIILNIIINSYNGLFVDEYQDCTKSQHELIMIIATVLPTRLFGDPLQAIFGFNESLVNLENSEEMLPFSENIFYLDTPNRWIQSGNIKLGEDLKIIRNNLQSSNTIYFNNYKSINYKQCDNIYNSYIRNLILQIMKDNENVLVIDPNSTNIASRIKFIQSFNNIPTLIESIDHSDFYDLAEEIDRRSHPFDIGFIFSILEQFRIITKTSRTEWVNDKNIFKNKKLPKDKLSIKKINENLKNFNLNFSKQLLATILKQIISLPNIKCYRRGLLCSICEALNEAEIKHISVYNALILQRNMIRRIGRKLYGKCIGTTLLTKGLEAETVIVINAHAFTNPKHLYVALTRASKNLYVFSNDIKLTFNL